MSLFWLGLAAVGFFSLLLFGFGYLGAKIEEEGLRLSERELLRLLERYGWREVDPAAPAPLVRESR